jgi:AcrR family transcriptional regulator
MGRPSTREKLLDCAEQLFADHGLKGVSLRAINAEAGLSPAALHYHFGTKEALVEALLDRQMPDLMERRRRMLDALESRLEPAGAREVLEALIRPQAELLAKHAKAGHRYSRLLYRLQADGDLYSLFSHEKYSGGVDRLVPLLQAALPQLPLEVIQQRLGLTIDVILRSLALDLAASGSSLEAHVSGLLDFLTGALEAVCTDEPT